MYKMNKSKIVSGICVAAAQPCWAALGSEKSVLAAVSQPQRVTDMRHNEKLIYFVCITLKHSEKQSQSDDHQNSRFCGPCKRIADVMWFVFFFVPE
jgi:hypothetical protein